VSTFAPNGPFLAREKSQLALVCNDFLEAFQAYDEGSIPFTRSNLRALGASVGKPSVRGLNRSGLVTDFSDGRRGLALASTKGHEKFSRGAAAPPRSVAQWLEHRSPNSNASVTAYLNGSLNVPFGRHFPKVPAFIIRFHLRPSHGVR
jgi:hypothetical protein